MYHHCTFNFVTGSVSTSSTATTTTIATTTTTTTTVTEPSSITNSCAMNPNSTMCLVTDDETGNDSVCYCICRNKVNYRPPCQ